MINGGGKTGVESKTKELITRQLRLNITFVQGWQFADHGLRLPH
jgi:hypothetical protein